MNITVVLEALTADFDTDIDRSAKRADKRFKEMSDTAARAAKIIATAAAAAGAAFAVLTKREIDAADQMAKLSQTTGIAVETLSGLELAGELAGVSLEDIGTGLNRLSRTALDAATGLKTAKDSFAALDIDVKKADGSLKSLDELLPEIADKFAAAEDGTAKAAVAQELFGRAGAKLIPLLNQGSAGLEEMRAEAEALGLIIDGNTAKAAERFNDNLTRLGFAARGMGRSIAEQLLPGLEHITESFVKSAKEGGALQRVADGVAFAFKGILSVVLGAGFVLNEFGESLGAIAAQIAALATLDFEQAEFIGQDFAERQVERMEEFSRTIEEIWNGTVKKIEERTATGKIKIIDDKAAQEAAKAAAEFAKEVEKARSDVLALAQDSSDPWTKYEEGVRRVNEALSLHAVTAQESQAALEQLEAERDEALDRQKEKLKELSSFADEAARNIQTSFADFLFDPFDQGLEGMAEGFARTIQRMLAELAAAQILKQLFGDGGLEGALGNLVAGAATSFGGGRQYGGDVFRGHSYLVGEDGPEIIVPRAMSKVVPISQLDRGGTTQVFNITTPDANSFRLSERQIMRRQRMRLAIQ